MSLSNKKAKAVAKLIKDRSPEEISKDLNIPVQDILDHLQTSGLQKTIDLKNESQLSKEDQRSLIFISIYSFLIFIAPLICMGPTWFDFANLAQCIYIQTISIIFVILWFLEGYLRGKVLVKKSIIYIPIYGLIIWAGLSLSWSTNVYEGLTVYSQWVACSIIFFVLYNSIRSKTHITILFTGLAFSTTFIILIALMQYFNPNFSLVPQVISPAATFGNKNMMMHFILSMVPIILYFILIKVDNEFVIINIVAALFLALACNLVFLTQTRTGMLGLVIQTITGIIILFLVFKTEGKESIKHYLTPLKAYFIGGAIVLFCVIMMAANASNNSKNNNATKTENSKNQIVNKTPQFDYLERFLSIFKQSEEEKRIYNRNLKDEDLQAISDSKNMRKVQWRNTWEMAWDRPLTGFGIYNWQIHYAEYRRAYYNDPVFRPGMMLVRVHNDYLQVFVDLGIPGVLFLCGIGIGIFFFGFSVAFKKEVDHHLSIKSVFAMLSIIGIMTSSLTSFPFEKSIPVLILFLMTAIILAIYDMVFPKDKKEFALSKKVAIGGMIIFGIIFLININIQNRRAKADQYHKTAYDELNNGNTQVVIEAALKSLKNNPLRSKNNIVLGMAYYKLKQNHKAIKELEIGLTYYPNDLSTLATIGSCYVSILNKLSTSPKTTSAEMEKYAVLAAGWFKKALNIRNDFYDIWDSKGLVSQILHNHYKKKNPILAKEYMQKAKKYFEKAITLEPENTKARLHKAHILYGEKIYEESIIIYEDVIKKLTNNYETANTTLDNYLKSDNSKNSRIFQNIHEDHNKKLLSLLNNSTIVINNLQLYYSQTQNLKGFLKTLEYKENEIRLISFKVNKDFNKAQQVKDNLDLYKRAGQSIESVEQNYEEKKTHKEKVDKDNLIINAKIQYLRAQYLDHLSIKDSANRMALSKQSFESYKKAIVALNKINDLKECIYASHLKIAKYQITFSTKLTTKIKEKIKENITQANKIKATLIQQNKINLITPHLQLEAWVKSSWSEINK